jgi:IS605 OrfB family transposase
MHQADGRWEVSVTTDVAGAPLVTDRARGAIGTDLNSGILTMAETNRHSSVLSSVVLQTPYIGLDANQRADARGCAVKQGTARCLRTGKPLVLESLDFRQKKHSLAQRPPGSRRKLHALAYNQIQELPRSRALDAGVEVLDIDPAYTSTQGRGARARDPCTRGSHRFPPQPEVPCTAPPKRL